MPRKRAARPCGKSWARRRLTLRAAGPYGARAVLEAEARWLRDRLAELPAGELSPLLNLGSSDLQFRAEVQPYIDREVFAPLRERGVAVVHSDLKESPGVDIAADALSEEGFARLREVGARAVMCCNMFEHVVDRDALAARIDALVPAGGVLILTAPESYPYHPDPIDTYYRVAPEDMARELFPRLQPVRVDVVVGPTYGRALLRRPWLLVRDLRDLAGLKDSPCGRAGSRLKWLTRPYRISCAVLRRR